MRHAIALTGSLLILAGCGNEPAPPPPGGQSGDDGDVEGDRGGPPVDPAPPGVPDSPCDPAPLQLEPSEPTPFGASPGELVAALGSREESPLFWVAFDQIPGVTFSPAPGETALTLALSANGTSTFTSWRPKAEGASCPPSSLRVPVIVTVRTSDGALDESALSELVFSSASTATLPLAELPAESLRGSFAFEALGDPAEGYAPGSLLLEANFWPGGSRGSITPFLRETGPVHPPPNPTAPAVFVPGSPIPTPSVPEHWGTVAVWPRRERCENDGSGHIYAFAPDEPLIGSSMRDIVDVLNAQGPWSLSLAEGTTRVRFEVEAPAGLRCAGINDGVLSLPVRATLRTESDEVPALATLVATSVYDLTVKPGSAGELRELRWERRDVVTSESRGAFEDETGFALDADGEYDQIWWSWHGLEVREGETWVARGGLVVSSPNREQAAEIARIQALGGPGFGIEQDAETRFPILPGDALIDAEIVP